MGFEKETIPIAKNPLQMIGFFPFMIYLIIQTISISKFSKIQLIMTNFVFRFHFKEVLPYNLKHIL